MPTFAQELDAARLAVYLAGRVCRLIQQNAQGLRAIVKDDNSPVTVADFASQAIVARTLAERLGGPDRFRLVGEESAAFLRDPAHGAHLEATVGAVQEVWPDVTEESLLEAIDLGAPPPAGSESRLGREVFWTLDPVDGTKGFVRGGQYCVALARVEAGNPTLAAMCCPNLPRNFNLPLDEADLHGCIYLAERGGDNVTASGIYELPADDPDAKPLHIVRPDHEEDGPISVCESVEPGHTDHAATEEIIRRLGRTRDPARIDSQCKYAVVARGQADVYIRLPRKSGYVENIWDHAAGALIAAEAGCLVSDATGHPLDFSAGTKLVNNRGIVAAPPRLHGRLIDAIRDVLGYGPTR